MKLEIKNKFKHFILPIKYVFSAGISFVIDQLIFNIIMYFLKQNLFIVISKLIARAISSFVNYLLNSKMVFKRKDKNSIFKYYGLVVFQALVSSFSIYIIKLLCLKISITIISIIVDIIIFCANYFIQKKFVFKSREV